MKNIKAILVAVAATAAIGAGGIWYVAASQDQTVKTTPDQSANQQSAEQEAVDKVVISGDGRTVSYDGQTGKTALEVLRSLTDVNVEESSFGAMVTGIAGKQAETGKEYWAFYVDGGYASEGAGTYTTKDTDKIEWRLEEIQQ